MKEHPILFSGPMVRAILEGRKTQTRRLCAKAVDETGRPATDVHPDGSGKGWIAWWSAGRVSAEQTSRLYPGAEGFPCPHGSVGSRLWVRETWGSCAGGVVFRADDFADRAVCPDGGKWKPSIFMPRWASRITLEVTGVRAERLHDITDEDAKAEGIEKWNDIADDQRVPGPGFNRCRLGDQPHRLPFSCLWDDINEKRAPWDSNPWVWVVEFRRAA